MPTAVAAVREEQVKVKEEEEEEERISWEEALRRMLPEGAPLPDEEHLDYSIAVEYEGPPLPQNYDHIPRVNPVESFSRFNRVSFKDFKLNSSPNARRRRQQEEQQSPRIQNSPTEDDYQYNTTTDDFSSPPRSEVTADSPIEVQKPNFVSDEISKETRKKDKRGRICSRCGKKSRLKEREACLVCVAKYCSSCLIKAMGSMPEGRKCVGCIGKPIDESKRSSLGKASKILCKVFGPLEVRQIMKAEKECCSNQLRPEQLIVNGEQLNEYELAELLGCPMPPLKLKPGKYWYDKDSGLWGKV